MEASERTGHRLAPSEAILDFDIDVLGVDGDALDGVVETGSRSCNLLDFDVHVLEMDN